MVILVITILASGKWPRNVESPLKTTVYSVFSTELAAVRKFLQISVINELACKMLILQSETQVWKKLAQRKIPMTTRNEQEGFKKKKIHLQRKHVTFSELSALELVKMKKHKGLFLNCSTSDATLLQKIIQVEKLKQNLLERSNAGKDLMFYLVSSYRIE